MKILCPITYDLTNPCAEIFVPGLLQVLIFESNTSIKSSDPETVRPPSVQMKRFSTTAIPIESRAVGSFGMALQSRAFTSSTALLPLLSSLNSGGFDIREDEDLISNCCNSWFFTFKRHRWK